MVLGWTFDPRAGRSSRSCRSRRALAEAIGLPPGTRWSSFRDLVANDAARRARNDAQAAEQQERPLTKLQKSAQKLEGRLYWMVQFFRHEAILALPAEKPGDAWTAPEPCAPRPTCARCSTPGVAAGRLAPERIPAELLYNRAGPTRIAWWVLTLSLLLSIAAMALDRRALELAAGAALFAGFAVMTWGIAQRWLVAGRIPASNMYESMLFLGWGVGLFAVISLLVRNRILIFNSAAMSALAMLLLDRLPIDPFIHPMPPVLSGTPWLAIHVPIIMVGYAILAIVTLFAHVVVGVEIFAPDRREIARRWSQLAYWYIHVGSILLIAGILTGSIWAASSWGRYWGWDPKEVWSLVAFLAYMAILHARFDRQIGTSASPSVDRRLLDDPDDLPRGELRARRRAALLRLRRLEPGADHGDHRRRGGDLHRRRVGHGQEGPRAAA